MASEHGDATWDYDSVTDEVSRTLFAIFDEILQTVVVRRPTIPNSSAN